MCGQTIVNHIWSEANYNLNSFTFVRFNPIQDGGGRGGQKGPPPTNFCPVTSTNVGISPQNFLTFSLNPFSTLLQNFKVVPSASHKLLNLNQDHPSKKRFSWSNAYKIEVVRTSVIEMLELPNFGHMSTSTIQFESSDNILLVASSTEIMTS